MSLSRKFLEDLEEISEQVTGLKKYQVCLMSDKDFVDHIDDLVTHFQNYSKIWLAGHFSNAFTKKVRNIPQDTIKKVDFRIMSIDPKNNPSNHRALKQLEKMGANVIIHPDLHARLFIGFTPETQKMILIIGSYDYNREGLSGDKDNIGITTNNPELVFEARQFYMKLWNQVKPQKKEVLFNESFDKYQIGDQLLPEWTVTLDEGNVQVVESKKAPWESKKCVMVKNGGTRTHILHRILEFKKGIIDYWIKIDKEFKDFGSPLIIMSPDSIKRAGVNEDYRAIYMDVTGGKLRRDSGKKEIWEIIDIIQLIPDEWHNIVMDIDCSTHSYDLTIDGKTQSNLKFPSEFKSINNIRTKYGFGQGNQWKTYIGKIKITSKD